jgi:hypothetical protein
MRLLDGSVDGVACGDGDFDHRVGNSELDYRD